MKEYFIASSRLFPRKSALPRWNIKVGLAGSALRADRHADSTCEGSIFLDAKTSRPAARGDPSSGRLESCAHSSFGVCALPTCVEKPARVTTKKAGAISSNTRICASPRDWCRYRYLPGRRRGRQITDQDWHFQTAPLRDSSDPDYLNTIMPTPCVA